LRRLGVVRVSVLGLALASCAAAPEVMPSADEADEVAGGFAHAAAPCPVIDDDRPAPAFPEVERGDGVPLVWSLRCKMCHGSGGDGNTAMGRANHARNLADPVWQKSRSDAQIHKVICRGVPDSWMRAYAPLLTPEQVGGLVVYIRALEKR
jgi:hypothetical protein